MIDPEKVTNYKQTDRQLEEFILFWVCAAGKNGRTAARCLENLMEDIEGHYWGPMQAVFRATQTRNLPYLLKENGIGCYMSKARSFLELALVVGSKELNLHTCAASDLESIYGIGCKTSRCFILHSREGAQVAGLDTHMLKYLRAKGYDDVPKSTPTGKKYLTNEKRVLSLAKEAGMTPAQFDLWVWNKYSIKSTPKA